VSLEALASGCPGSLIGQTNTVVSMTMGTVEGAMVAAMVDMAEGLAEASAMAMVMGMDEGVAGDELSTDHDRIGHWPPTLDRLP
jgi:acyl-coenzyme A thioesterase PaaI-like protein